MHALRQHLLWRVSRVKERGGGLLSCEPSSHASGSQFDVAIACRLCVRCHLNFDVTHTAAPLRTGFREEGALLSFRFIRKLRKQADLPSPRPCVKCCAVVLGVATALTVWFRLQDAEALRWQSRFDFSAVDAPTFVPLEK
jgi:hypothetical protein